MRPLTPLLLASVLALSLVACGGDDDTDQDLPNTTPIGTKDLTPAPSGTAAPGDGGAAPEPIDPQIDEELTETARGELEAVIEPAAAYEIDPEALAAEAGNAPSCDNFQFDFSWQVTDPFPGGEALRWQMSREGAEVEIASGASGNQAIGCNQLSAVNNGDATITVSIKYAIGGIIP
jgi:hypothetical protein